MIWASHRYCVCLGSQGILGEPGKLPPAEMSCLWTHKKLTSVQTSNTYQLLQSMTCITRHMDPCLVLQFSVQFQVHLLPPLHSNSEAAAYCLRTPTPQANARSLVRKSAIEGRVCIFDHLTYAKLGYLYEGPVFLLTCHWQRFWVSCPNPTFFLHPGVFLVAVWVSWYFSETPTTIFQLDGAVLLSLVSQSKLCPSVLLFNTCLIGCSVFLYNNLSIKNAQQ